MSNDRPFYELPPEGPITFGSHVQAAFRLADQLPFLVRQDCAKLIYLYMHDPVAYLEKRVGLFKPRDVEIDPREPAHDPLAVKP